MHKHQLGEQAIDHHNEKRDTVGTGQVRDLDNT